MYPLELDPETLRLPETDDHSIVIVTGNGLRHKRFAYRIQQAFGDQVVGWFELDETAEPVVQQMDAGAAVTEGLIRRLVRGDIVARGRRRLAARGAASQVAAYFRSLAQAEQALFRQEVEHLKQAATLTPTCIHPRAVNQPAFVAQLQALNPYFFLTLGGPLYKKPVLDAVRGVAINQHAGHSPLFKGSNTTEWALYHRHLAWVSATVHITTSGADAGPILRRSQPCLMPDDSPAMVFLRVVALGAELMIECVQELIANKQVMIFPQPRDSGRTYLSKEFKSVIGPLLRDFRHDWLGAELARQRDF